MSHSSYVFDVYQWFLNKHVKDDAAMLTLATMVSQHAESVRAVAHGDVNGMGGLEALTVAIAGKGIDLPLSTAIYDAANAIAESLRNEDAE